MLRALSMRSALPSVLASRAGKRSVSLNRPGPPLLPPKEQREFEELVRAAEAASASGHPTLHSANDIADDGQSHRGAHKRPAPEFEGDMNPITGEIGGPKNEPLQHGDWSFGGRASDF